MMGAKGRNNRCGIYYDAPEQVLVPKGAGVTIRVLHEATEYRGTAAALVGIGLLPLHLFPGQPGMPKTVVSLRPNGGQPVPDKGWWRTPGYLVVRRHLDGMFTATLRGYVEDPPPPASAPDDFRQQLQAVVAKAAAIAEAHRRVEQELQAGSSLALQAWGYTAAVLEHARQRSRHG
jgi:hypothetical protein